MTRKRSQTLHVDPIACSGHGVCAELFVEWIRLDDWGYPIIRPEPIPSELVPHARWAVSNCPALALKLRRTARRRTPDRETEKRR
jgi:ferredoxin